MDRHKLLGPLKKQQDSNWYRRFAIGTNDTVTYNGQDHFIARDSLTHEQSSRYNWIIYIAGQNKAYCSHLTVDEAKAKFDELLIGEGYTLLTEERVNKLEVLL